MSNGTAVAENPAGVAWWVPLVMGILTVIVGIMFLSNPAATSVTFALVIGIYWFVRGIMDIVLIFVDKTLWGLKLFAGLLGIGAGWIVASWVMEAPFLGTLTLGATFVWVLGIMGIAMGIADIVHAFKGAGWGRGLLGVLMIFLGLWLIAEPVQAAFALPWTMGIMMIFFGTLSIVSAFQLKKA